MKIDSQARCIHLAYRYLESITPLRWDCGKICGKACCKGDEHAGMWLLPGEEKLLQDRTEFSIRPCRDNGGYPLLVCQDFCDRKYRPFACRIYPFFPLVIEDEKKGLEIRIICDPRAMNQCPLAQYSLWHNDLALNPIEANTRTKHRQRISTVFLLHLRRATEALLTDQELRQYLLDTSHFLLEMTELREKFGRL